MRKIGVAIAFVLANTAQAVGPGWPPEPLIEMHVQAPPSAFPSAGRTYLVYEVLLTNLDKTTLDISRLEVHDADDMAAAPIAVLEAEQLDKDLQHFGDPAVGDRIPDATAAHRHLTAGETVIVFLAIVVAPDARIPERLSHRLFTGGASIEGAIVRTRATRLRVIGPPVEGNSWHAFSGAGDNNSHHRRQLFVLGGHASLPNRHAIDWVHTENGANFSGPEGENRSYYSYGRRVLAVADGTVVKVTDGIPDNAPGHVGAESLKLSLETFAGNTIVLDLGQGQYAHYMHLQTGSPRVKVGQRIRRRELIALVGTSGSSFEPHLHFEVTTSPAPGVGEGLPYLLDEYEVVTNGVAEYRRRELPTEGMTVNFASAR